MPKAKSKGGKKKKRGKNFVEEKRKLEFAEDGQAYGRVIKMLGDGRLEAKCSDGETRICHIRGKMRKRIWINADDLILVEIRSYQPDKADIVYKYNNDEDRTLLSYGELINGTAKVDEDEKRGEKEKREEKDIQFGFNSDNDSSDDSDNSDNNSDNNKDNIDDILDDILDDL